MPAKDGADLRQCVELLSKMLEIDSASKDLHRGTQKLAHPVRVRKPVITTGRLTRHDVSSRTAPPSRGRVSVRTGGRTGRASGCSGSGRQRRPLDRLAALNENVDEDDWEVVEDEGGRCPCRDSIAAATAVVAAAAASTGNRPGTTHDEVPGTPSRPVLFNQRLLSSTPADTPQRKTLVERNGVLYLNGSTDTLILNATDDARAARPPSPPRSTGPNLVPGAVTFAAAPSRYVPSATADAYSLYSSADERLRQPVTATDSNRFQPTSFSSMQPQFPSSAVFRTPSGLPTYSFPPTSHVAVSSTFYETGIPTSIERSAREPGAKGYYSPHADQQFELQDRLAAGCRQPANGVDLQNSAPSLPVNPPYRAETSRRRRGSPDRTAPPPSRRVESRHSADSVRRHCNQGGRTSRPRSSQSHRVALRTGADIGRNAAGSRKSAAGSMSESYDMDQLVPLLKRLRELVRANPGTEVAKLVSDICEAARDTPSSNAVPQTIAEMPEHAYRLPVSSASSSDVPSSGEPSSRSEPSSSSLPYSSVDLELAMQPLRSENVQLRRQLRIATQQLREKDELVSAMQKPDESFQVLHLTMLNRHMEKQLEESRTEVETVRRRLEVLTEDCDRLAREKAANLQLVARKEDELSRHLEDGASMRQKMQSAIDEARREKLQAEHRVTQLCDEVHRLTLQLGLKDAENQKSRDLIRNLHSSMSRLIHDLQTSRPVGTTSLMSGRLNETMSTIQEQLSQLEPVISFATPALRTVKDSSPQLSSARRSLDFGAATRDRDRLLSHDALGAASSMLDFQPLRCTTSDFRDTGRPTTPRRSMGATTVKELLTPIAKRLQAGTLSSTAFGSCSSPLRTTAAGGHSNELDVMVTDIDDSADKDVGNRTLTENDEQQRFTCQQDLRNVPPCAVNDSDESRWSSSDYFRKYPHANPPDYGQLGFPASTSGFCSDSTQLKVPISSRYAGDDVSAVAACRGDEDDISASLSPIRRSGVNTQSGISPRRVPSETGSNGTASSLDSVSTEDDITFRAGLAQLDANIARIQRQLRGSVSSPVPADVTQPRLSTVSVDSAPY